MSSDEELADALRRRGWFVAPAQPAGAIPDREVYRPYFSGTEVYQPAFGSPIVAATIERLLGAGKRTLVTEPKLGILLSCLRQVASLEGEVWELGVFQGGSALTLKAGMVELGLDRRSRLRLFDTFAGLPAPDPDVDLHRAGEFHETSLEEVRSLVGSEDFVSYHPGLVPETFAGLESGRIRLAHVDLDLYASIRDALAFVHPRLVPGGVIVFDDYGVASCPGARRAVDEFYADRPETPIVLPTGQALVFRLQESETPVALPSQLRPSEPVHEEPVVVDVTHARILPFDRDMVTGFSLDRPAAVGAPRPDRRGALELAGWVTGARRRVLSIEAHFDGQALRLLPVQVERPDVAENVETAAQGIVSGFAGEIGLLGLPAEFEIVLKAVLRPEGGAARDRIRVPVAVLEGRRTPLEPRPARRRPLMLTSLGRSGTSHAVRMLAEHPEILAVRRHPYEMRPGAYWMHALKVLADPADHHRSSVPDGFENSLFSIGQNPFAHPRYLEALGDRAGIESAFGRDYQDDLRGMCLRAVDRFYDAVADDLGQADAPWFVEKLLPSHLQWIAWEIYADVREIVLVRDFRDVVCSARAFNQRRRHLAFGRERAASDEQWIRNMAEGGVRRLWTAWQRRSDRAHLVRYEDLVRDPHATLGRVFEYVGVDASDTVVAGVLERAGRESEETRDHRTTATGRESIGRWRRDLDEPLAEVAQAAMGPALKAFGYDD